MHLGTCTVKAMVKVHLGTCRVKATVKVMCVRDNGENSTTVRIGV